MAIIIAIWSIAVISGSRALVLRFRPPRPDKAPPAGFEPTPIYTAFAGTLPRHALRDSR
ncbi:hypothetical protein BKA25_002071 [Actinoalloteichus hymeniacidonis]|uniref:Uncharacterized protein n=1 Tax=Actinoalloteichus hymeniacidonis TaxID=340345 RepID=A0AAC9HRD9_9PSEU|nr:hypothetical protein TL08_16885 [Actinoalloteichus hymeniacidonis]MBB5907755.1 hypothetical protein [Actinoalloteichus hymeniacidonis]